MKPYRLSSAETEVNSPLKQRLTSAPNFDPQKLQQHYDKVLKYMNREPMRKSAFYMDELKVFSHNRVQTLFDVDVGDAPTTAASSHRKGVMSSGQALSSSRRIGTAAFSSRRSIDQRKELGSPP